MGNNEDPQGFTRMVLENLANPVLESVQFTGDKKKDFQAAKAIAEEKHLNAKCLSVYISSVCLLSLEIYLMAYTLRGTKLPRPILEQFKILTQCLGNIQAIIKQECDDSYEVYMKLKESIESEE